MKALEQYMFMKAKCHLRLDFERFFGALRSASSRSKLVTKGIDMA